MAGVELQLLKGVGPEYMENNGWVCGGVGRWAYRQKVQT